MAEPTDGGLPEPPEIGVPVSDEGKLAVAREVRKAARSKQLDLDVRGLLALMALGGALALSGAILAIKGTAELPQWATTMVGAVLGFYFGARASGSDRRKSDNGD